MNHEHERQAGESELKYHGRVENAWMAGRKIQFQSFRKGDWQDLEPWEQGQVLFWQHNYRIAPGQQEPAKVPKQERAARDWWIIPTKQLRNFKFDENVAWCEPGSNKPDGVGWAELGIHVREVLPGDDVEALRAERDAAIEARDNALTAMRDMRAELDKEKREAMDAQAVADKWHAKYVEGVINSLEAKDRIIALQDELATVRNECATLSAKLTEATR